ncbi:FadR/GntR family transcriptional regulator [Caenimonas sp. SL110]|uniref:FadR/GntR family transcriptional regulator n=1 Tax=Caenimonas sp. SL110 TaxID=1450524 RepID=UPI0006529F10|nr:FadR/GntR family transcriptional regulator [Caenimonas sp. SL110]
MPLQTVEPQRLYRQIAEQLRALMKSGEFEPGSRLPAERDLAKQLGVSRPSVREALIALEVEGWVEVRTGSGVYVLKRSGRTHASDRKIPASEWGPLELIRARRVVEGEIASLAAQQAKRKDVQAIRAAIDQMTEDADQGVAPLAGDRAFHTAIAQACGNVVLLETVQTFWDARNGPLFERLGDYFESVPSWRKAITEHESVLESIRAHDADGARAAMQQHMDKSHGRFNASWRRANSS